MNIMLENIEFMSLGGWKGGWKGENGIRLFDAAVVCGVGAGLFLLLEGF